MSKVKFAARFALGLGAILGTIGAILLLLVRGADFWDGFAWGFVALSLLAAAGLSLVVGLILLAAWRQDETTGS